MENTYVVTSNGELYHFGIKGQKWGVRRYQNPDGTLTDAGKKRLADELKSDYKRNRVSGQPFRTSAEYDKKVGQAVDSYITDSDKRRIKAAKDRWRSAEDKARAAEDALDKLAEEYGKKWYGDELRKHSSSYDTPRSKEKLYEYAVYDHGYDKARKSRPDLEKVVNDAHKQYLGYVDECKKVSDTILGKYGETKLYECEYYSLSIKDTVGDIVSSKDMENWKL